MSGFKVNFSVNNQLATPSIHAAALANRPAAGQPGRVFIDTDNPSTGIYRDTGTNWVQIGAGAGVLNLQNVTDNGNTTSNSLILLYDSFFNGSNQIDFFDLGTDTTRYSINKLGLGNRLTIQGTSPTSNRDMGLMIDAPNDTLRTFWGFSFDTRGVSLDFTNNIYRLGNVSGTAGQQGIYIDAIGEVGIGNTNPSYLLDVTGTARVSGTELRLDNGTTGTINIYSATPRVNFFSGGGYYIGRTSTSLELVSGGNIALFIGANQGYGLDATNGHLFRSAIAGSATLARLTTSGNLIVGGTTDAGFRLDVRGQAYIDNGTGTQAVLRMRTNLGVGFFYGDVNSYLSWNGGFRVDGILQLQGGLTSAFGQSYDYNSGNIRNVSTLGINTSSTAFNLYCNGTIRVDGQLSASAGGNSGQHLIINCNGTQYKIALLNP